MATKPQRYVELIRRVRMLDMEATEVRRQAMNLKREMGHPFDDQIEQAANDGKEIVRGCTQDP